MARHILVWIGVWILITTQAIAQTGLQIGANFGVGRSYTTVDLTQASANNLSAGPGVSVPMGLELAWQFGKHWRISAGIGYLYQGYRINAESRPFDPAVITDLNATTFPFLVSFLIPGGSNSRKGFIVGAGASMQYFEERDGVRTSGSRRSDGVEATGFTSYYRTQSNSDPHVTLQFLVGQSWQIGKRDRLRLELDLIYSMGLGEVFTGEYLFWNEPPPEDFPFGDVFLDVMPEPSERYPGISSQGSYLVLQLRFFYNTMVE